NKMDLTGIDKSKMEVIAITNKVTAKAKKKAAGQGGATIGTATKKTKKEEVEDTQQTFSFESGEIERAIVAKVVQKVGNRHHWEDWANDISKIAQTHIKLITEILQRPECDKERAVFEEFAIEIRDDLNNAVSDAEIIEMLAQHLITKPVFDALFDEYSFAKHNPMAVAMQKVLDVLDQHQIDSETQALERFYESVKMRAAGIDSAEGKQKIIVELYDKFFRNAFPRMTERLGIVYTPVEVVDFILHSVNDVLKQEFGKTIADKGVHVIDPFTGTGTFITRLIQSGLIPQDQLVYKYKNELHANELVLLAYYIAAINIEAVYHSYIIDDYTPFEGICLTDTFQMYEKEDLVDEVLVDNSARRKRQKELDIQVIIGNPPYSSGQDSANDNNANVKYPVLDEKIRITYAKDTKATNINGLYDSYIRAIRWASDRIKDNGVIGFVTNANFVDSNTADGLRKCLVEEFSSLYIFHLRGNQRTSGERSRKEGGKIFGSGSRAPIAISILVKNPEAKDQGKLYFHDIGDYLNRDEKLQKISGFKSLQGIIEANAWELITPNEHGDWVNQRDESFSSYISIGDKKNKLSNSLFQVYSGGVKTNRDAWCYNASRRKLIENIKESINFYNSEVERSFALVDRKSLTAEKFVEFNSQKFSWDRANKWDLEKGKYYSFEIEAVYKASYRPFYKSNIYFHKNMNNMVYLMPKIFPTPDTSNLVIALNGVGAQKDFSALISANLPDLHLMQTGQCFPLYVYEEVTQEKNVGSGDLFDNSLNLTMTETKYQRKDGISAEGLQHFQAAYPSEQITKEDIFYYTYGLLHSEEYRTRYADNLTKELPRIPCVKKAEDFWAFSKAGRDLAHWHLNYETVAPYKTTLDTGTKAYKELLAEDFYVEKMKFAKKGEKGTVIYNKRITIKDIPVEAYEYVVNGKPALEWVMERQGVSTHKDSGIVNDANDWANETMNNPAYPLELFLRVITVSLETMKIVKGLPKLDI
ncbi:type ISP restriction/modification enzyme, partial [Acinetobacter bohemicus]|uniref:type ISP restriction/modification enzyme n=1 Tax=Acinetobacter bohemicus TaxID=1435036 RepID=UPI003FA22E34